MGDLAHATDEIPTDRESRRYTGALTKAALILGVLEREAPLSASEIAARLEIDRSTAYRLSQALWQLGWLRYDPETKRYGLGMRLWELGAGAIAELDVRQVARPYMRDVVARTGESCDLAVLDGADIVYVEVIEGTREVRAATQLGERVPAHAVAMGKALMAHLSHAERARLLPRSLRRFTPLTAATIEEFNERADKVLRVGYAVNLGEHNPEAGGMAVPIRDGPGRTVAAIGINVPAVRMTAEKVAALAPVLVDAAAAISGKLGHRVGSPSSHLPGRLESSAAAPRRAAER